MSVVIELIRNIINTPFEKIDCDAIERARGRLIDVVGCILGGAHASGCSILVDLVREWGGTGDGTILVHGVKIPAHHAAMTNCIMARSYDFDPIGPLVDGKSFPAHISATTVPVAIATAEQTGASGKDLITSLILGDDVASRIIAASQIDSNSGFESTGTVNAFGAAAIAGRLWGLNEDQMLNAFGIVLNQLGGTFQNIYDGAHSFKLPQGLSAQAGMFAVALAKKGFTGVLDPLLSRYGYFGLYCKSPQLEVLTKNLGTQFYGDNSRKPYPGCRTNHAAIQCTLDILNNKDLKAEDIDEVVVGVTANTLNFAVGQPFTIRRVPEVDAAFSLQYTIASTLLRRGIRLENFTESFIRDPMIMEIVSKIRIEASMSPEKYIGASVKIRMNQGAEYETEVILAKGHGILTPLSKAEERQKFMDQAAFSGTIPLSKAQDALSLLEKIEEIEHIDRLIELLVP
jgi:2-methylcitrate dehydratase PrpD